MLLNFKTKRCLIRPFIIDDIDDFMDYRNNEKWMIYQNFKGLSKEKYIEELIDEKFLDDGVQLAIICDSMLIGDVFLKKDKQDLWFGYTISPKYARQGFAFEVASKMIELAYNEGVKKICAGVSPENTPSINLLKKLKFQYIKTDEGDYIYTRNI